MPRLEPMPAVLGDTEESANTQGFNKNRMVTTELFGHEAPTLTATSPLLRITNL